MKWKEFFKPNLKKIIVLVILFCMFSIFLFVPAGKIVRLVGGPSGTFYCPFILGMEHSKFCFLVEFGTYAPITIISLQVIFNFIFSYLVSCLIIYSYDKFRNKK